MNKLEKIPSYKKGVPYKPIYETDFLDELIVNWGEEWGIKSAFGKIRKIMVYRPGEEQEDPLIAQDYQLFNLPEGPTDLAKLRKQHDNLVAILKAEGIDVVYLEPKSPLVGTFGIPLRSAIYTRETIMVRGGAIISRSASAYKKGLEVFHAKRLMELGCPILHTIHGRGVFETSNMVWIDDHSVILATGMRGNIGMFHLDMCFGMANPEVAVLWPGGVDYDTVKWLQKDKKVDIIELSDNELQLCGPNILVVSPNRVIVPAFNLHMSEELRKRGIEVIEVELSEFAKGGGGPTCMTLTLIRD